MLRIQLRPLIEVKREVKPPHKAVNFAQIVLRRHRFKARSTNITYITWEVFGGCMLEQFNWLIALTLYAASDLSF